MHPMISPLAPDRNFDMTLCATAMSALLTSMIEERPRTGNIGICAGDEFARKADDGSIYMEISKC